MTDLIADMLTRIRNAARAGHAEAIVHHSRSIRQIAEVLLREGYIAAVTEDGEAPHRYLRILLKYTRKGKTLEPVILHIRRLSKPGRRLYRPVDRIPRSLGGLGIVILFTSRGVLSDREARIQRLGGELVCEVW